LHGPLGCQQEVDVDAFFEIMKNPNEEVAAAGKADGVRPETAVVFIER
jgi:hypothetical protein